MNMTVNSQVEQRKLLPQKKHGFFLTLSRQWQLMIMSVPMLLYVLLFNYAPMWGWINAFRDYTNKKNVAKGITPFNGVDNFK